MMKIACAAFVAIAAIGVAPWFTPEGFADSKSFSLTVQDHTVDIGAGLKYKASTYGGTVPGPLLRVVQGTDVTIELTNHTSSAHGINVYAAQLAPDRFSGDPNAPVKYSFRAEVPGVFVYHCSAIPVLRHVADGMYGMMIVDPSGGWPNGSAHEVTITQGEFYGKPGSGGVVIGNTQAMIDSKPEFVVFDGAIDKYDVQHPIAIKVGELVRIFFVNAGPNLSSTFHVNGVIFSSVYRGGNPADAAHELPSFEVGPGTGAVFEFRVREPGDYQFLDQAMAHPYKGAIGLFRAAK
ncbi:MAG TPA: multicopper oxidase domain-containing protein [Candidatus Acidoferrales bacterium]|nr:multicopper oxidase domain-containing protein [Candidatus Acidoferrales bacterium]